MNVDEQFVSTNTATYRGAEQVPLIAAVATKAQLTGPVNMVVQKSGYLSQAQDTVRRRTLSCVFPVTAALS